MRAGPAWAAGLALSALAHGVAAVFLVPLYAPQDQPSQPPPETRLDMETVEAPRQDATAEAPDADTAAEGEVQGTSLGPGAVPQSDARPVTARAEPSSPVPPVPTRAQAASPGGARLAEAAPEAGRIAATVVGAEALAPAAAQSEQLAASPAPPAQTAKPAHAQSRPLASKAPGAEPAQAAPPRAADLAQSEATPLDAPVAVPQTERLAATEALPQALAAASAEATTVAATAADMATLSAAAPRAETAVTAAAPAVTLAAAAPRATTAPASAAAAPRLAALAPAITAGASLPPAPEPAAVVIATPTALPAAEPTGQPTAALLAEGNRLPQARADAADAEETAPPATSAKAALAWQFGDRLVTDPQALATIQAFMEPAALDDSEGVKDDLSSLLTGVDCARLSATFVPETGTLEMRGHIPDPELQGPILAALRAQVGEGIPVTANLLHLPAPQCGALTGISSVGLPQSTDQFTNARLVGATAHAREYAYTEGQRLQFDLTAPDYDAYVYVDYFNAEGDVIHLVPNDTIPLEEHMAESVFGVGKDRPGRPGLHITIGPPFGQEIAVAFASSHRLYDGVRPIVEPAAPYLEDLQALVAQARETHDDFKGEWVYFFITTAPATQ